VIVHHATFGESMKFIQKAREAVRHLLSYEEQRRRWEKTRQMGFLRYFLIHSFVIFPLCSIAGEILIFLILFGRRPNGVELFAGSIGGVAYAVPWSILTWLRANRMFPRRDSSESARNAGSGLWN
jgi:hypothetical protein